MPTIPSTSPATGSTVPPYFIHTSSSNFVDNAGRTLLLRGVNLSGSSKQPAGQASYQLEGFWESAEDGGDSFVNRPLNLEDGSADIHLSRLRGWGFNMLRYVVTWEALEHEGPGKYDFEFMDYTVRVLRKCKEYGFRVFMDPHQDIWSRFSGGSGAPYWTLLACGIEPRNLTATQATLLHCEYPLPSNPDPASFPCMIWSTNYSRLAAQTLFTFFFGGRDFAPKCIIDGVNIQDYLQDHFITAFGHLADRIRDAGDLFDECVIGWDSMNEPAEGFLGMENLDVIPKHQPNKMGSTPSPIQSLRLGMGQKQTVENWQFGSLGPQRKGSVTIDPNGNRLWLSPDKEDTVSTRWGWKRDPSWELGICPWALHRVWDPETGKTIKPDYFERPPFDPSRSIVFVADYWRPHFRKYAKRIRESHPEAILFMQPPVFQLPPTVPDDVIAGRGCYSPHYYDGLTLMSRHWNWINADALGMLRGKYSSVLQAVRIGESAIRKSIQQQLGVFKEDVRDIVGDYPTLIGEIGIPYDMDGKKAYGWTDNGKYRGDYSAQEKALDASLNATDGPNALNFTMWTFCPDSTHQWGDGWNMEDLSIWSADDLVSRSPPRAPPTPHRQQVGQETPMTLPDASDAQLLQNISRAQSIAQLGQSPSAAASSTTLGTMSTIVQPDDDGGYNSYRLRSLPHPRLEPPSAYALAPQDEGQSTTVLPQLGSKLVAPPKTTYKFLTDGARAFRAFSRPYPIATVGRPTDIQFDIKKAEFKLTVTVRAEDKPLSKIDVDGGDDGELLPTEIFVPLVHFAADPFADAEGATIGVTSTQRLPPSTMDLNRDATEPSSPGSLFLSPSPTSELPSVSAFALFGGFGTASVRTLVECTPLALDVTVSSGKWEIQGQVLRWHYPIPETESSAPLQHTITIRRAGGPIKLQQPSLTAISRSVGDQNGDQQGEGFCDPCCSSGSGCLIM